MRTWWQLCHGPPVSNHSVLNDRPESWTVEEWWIVVVWIYPVFLSSRKGQTNCECSVWPSLPLLPSCCLTKEVKDLGLSGPFSRARIWAADQRTAQHCEVSVRACFCGFRAACIRHHLLCHLYFMSPTRLWVDCNTHDYLFANPQSFWTY